MVHPMLNGFVGYDDGVRKVMSTQAVEIQVLKSHTSDVTSCDFAPDFVLATASSDKTIRIWEWHAGLGYVETQFSPMTGHKYAITYVKFSPQGTMLASCSRDGNTILWSAKNGLKIHKFPQVNGDTVRVCRFSPDSCTLATGGDNGIVCIWNLIHRTLLRKIQHHEDSVECLAFTSDSLFLLTTCTLGVLKIYGVTDICDTTVSDPTPFLSIDDAHDLGVLSCDFSNVIKTDETSTCSYYFMATSGNDQFLKQYVLKCTQEGKHTICVSELSVSFAIKDAHSSAITCVRYNEQGTMLGTSSLDKSVKLWNTEGQCLQTLDLHGRYVNCISFSRDGSFLCSGSNDKLVKICDITGGTISLDSEISKKCTLMSHFGCGDLKGISSINEDSILFLKKESADNEIVLEQTINGLHSAVINSVDFNHEGLLVTGSGDKTLKLLQIDESGIYIESEFSPIGNHRYQVNSVIFVNSEQVASCSLDGNIALWNTSQVDNHPVHIWSKSTASVKCVRASSYGYLMSVCDDGTAALWSLNSLSAVPLAIYPEHAEAASSCAFSFDGRLVSTSSYNGDFRIYELPRENENFNDKPMYIQEHAHDLGIESIDFAPHNNGLPLQLSEDTVCHLLATCGNDSKARIWKILIPKNGNINKRVTCIEWRVLSGHGSSLTCIRFAPTRIDYVCTTSTDMQARIWSVYSAQCLHVIEHNSLAATCAFSKNCKFLAVGCIEGQLFIWKLPYQMIHDTNYMRIVNYNTKNIMEWNTEDVLQWLKEVHNEESTNKTINRLLVRIHTKSITGKHLLNSSEHYIYEALGIDVKSEDETINHIIEELKWLRNPLQAHIHLLSCDIPHQFLCPITHDIMKDPVKCADGFTYERKAISEWFLCGGKYVSPMTNQMLLNNEITSNKELKKEIRKFLCNNISNLET